MFALAYVVNFLANEFARLCRSRFAFACVLFRSSDSFFFRHLGSPVDFAEPATAHVFSAEADVSTLHPTKTGDANRGPFTLRSKYGEQVARVKLSTDQ